MNACLSAKQSILSVFLLSALLLPAAARADASPSSASSTSPLISPEIPALGGPESVAGYGLKPYWNFWKTWNLVTVRYRKDTGEMRFAYANKVAWDALLKGVTDYPDGAVFGKVGVLTEEDQAFANSAVPSGALRIQLMVRDKKKYAATHGWGFGIFDINGRSFITDPLSKTAVTAKACDACHQLVPDRGYVFSQPMGWMAAFAAAPMGDFVASRVPFVTASTQALPVSLRTCLPPSIKELRLVQGPLRENMFPGTLNEIQPVLIAESRRANMPVALISSRDANLFSLVSAMPHSDQCKLPGGRTITLVNIYHIAGEGARCTSDIHYCDNDQ